MPEGIKEWWSREPTPEPGYQLCPEDMAAPRAALKRFRYERAAFSTPQLFKLLVLVALEEEDSDA